MKRYLVIVIAAMTLGTTALPALAQDEATKKELAALAGTWRVTAIEANGQRRTGTALPNMVVKVEGDRYRQEAAGQLIESGTLKLDPTAKPKTIDMTVQSGMAKGKVQRGIYRLEGDTWIVCAPEAGVKERPTEFTSKGGKGWMVFELKRVKEKDSK